MINRSKPNRVAPSPAGRPAIPGGDRKGRSGSARRARAGAATPRARMRGRLTPEAFGEPIPNPYEAFYAGGEDGVGLLDPGFDDWDLDPRVLLGLSAFREGGPEDL